MRRLLVLVLAIAGIISSILLVLKLRHEPPKPPPIAEPSRNPYAKSIAASGIVEAIHENVSIGVPTAGLVTEVYVNVADKVQKDQPLFKIDDRDLKAQLLVQEADIQTASATVQKWKDQLDRLHSVQDRRAVSASEIQTMENDVAVAEAQLASSKARIEETRLKIDRLTVKAPRSGTILQSNIRAGEYASINPKDPAILLGDVDHLQVRAQVDEQNAPRVQEGAHAVGFLKGSTEVSIPLEFVRIEPFVVPKESLTGASNERVDTRVLQVIFSFKQLQNYRVYVGQQVDVFIELK